ncbi:MAG: DUF1156 domain-containing protein [Pseudomonadota bacterium]
MTDKRFIEETFPVKEVSIESAREKNIRHGHISTLHIWWARRPLASSRATAYAALIPPPKDTEDWNKTRNFIAEFSKWENSLNQTMIQKARADILKANGGKSPRVLDPFGGGGAIPLEALRLGCETYSNDLNPVAVLIQKCTLEYPQKYGHAAVRPAGKSASNVREPDPGGKDGQQNLFGVRETETTYNANPLLADVKRWGTWLLEEARKEIGRFYTPDDDGHIPVGYIWARTIPCQNPACGEAISLMRQYWLSKKDKKKVSLFPYVFDGAEGNPAAKGQSGKAVPPEKTRLAGGLSDAVGAGVTVDAKRLMFRIVGTGYEPMPAGFDPEKGSVARAVATCPVCGSMVDANTTRSLFQEGKAGERMVAVVIHKPGQTGKHYRIATDQDMAIFWEAATQLEKKREELMAAWGMDPVPDEPLTRVPVSFGVINVWVYGMNTWGSLFNARQKLALITFADKVRQAHSFMLKEGYEPDYAKAVASYLGLIVSRCSDFESILVRWFNHVENTCNTFARQALPMTWDYFELNLFSPTSQGTYKSMFSQITKTLDHTLISFSSLTQAISTQASATSLPYDNNFFDAIFTDPPYYDNVPYSYLSDFFYVWLKRTLGDVHPDLFSTPLTPKKNEIVAYSHGEGGYDEGKRFFEDMLKQSFREIHRVLKPGGIAVIVYAHKSTEGWETLINSLLDSNLIMTGAWPLKTEMAGRMRAQESATLSSSIYIVARKMTRQPTGFYHEVTEELKTHLHRKLERLWQEGIGGADFFIAAIGSAIEVFGKYEQVMDYEGNIVRADRMLEDVRKIATEYAVRQILHDGFAGEISDLTRFYVLYRWNYGSAKILFDEAQKLARSCGIDIAREWSGGGFIRKEKEFIRVLGPEDREPDDIKHREELIDVLHRCLRLWEKGKRNDLVTLLQESGFGKSEAFYRVAQALSETIPNESKEKKLLDGFLAGRERLREEMKTTRPKQEILL